MDFLIEIPFVAGVLAFAMCVALGYWQFRRHGIGIWAFTYVREVRKRRPVRRDEEVHLLLCIADHYEPIGANASRAEADACVSRWLRDYPARLGGFRDSDGRPPRHTFFYPLEEYDPALLEQLAELCHAGYGEVEVQLHHDHDTAETLRTRLLDYKVLLSSRHGLLSRARTTGEVTYGFVHGNWALDNSRPDGRWCGVNNELDILRETGCFADFTMPSAPSPTQTRKINSLYYAVDEPARPKSHNWGVDVGREPAPAKALLLIQGPLVLGRRNLPDKFGMWLENGCLQSSQPPHVERLHEWLRARVQIPSRPDWFFVKLHTHGGEARNFDTLLGEPMVRFHRDLADYAQQRPNFHYHYVTAREMYNLVRAAESGWKGTVDAARDFELLASLPAPTEGAA
jgi:hypothetical protein